MTIEARSLDLCAVGLGQAGGWLAAEWRRRGYRALVLNTAKSDLRGLSGKQAGVEVPEQDQLHIAVDGADGAGRDPAWGRRCVREHETLIRETVQKQLGGADALLLMAGLGGGTGSAVDELVAVLEPLEIPILVLCTLPSDGESGIAKVNAVRAADAITRQQLAGRFFVDNGRLLEAFPNVDVVSYFQKVNARVLQPLDDLNRLNAREDLWSLQSFDGEDLRKVLLSSGALLIHSARLKDGPLAVTDFTEAAAKCVDGGEFLARGTELSQVAYLAVVVAGPERALKATPMHVFEETALALKKQTNGGAVFQGLYVTPDDQPLRVSLLASSLAMPKRVIALVQRATDEGETLARKIAVDLPGLETSALASLNLFRGPRRAPSLPPQMAPSTSLPAMPARAAPPMELASMVIPPTMVGKPGAVSLDSSQLPNLPDELQPSPSLVRAIPRFRAAAPLTVEGADILSSLPSLLGGPEAEAAEIVANYRAGDRKTKERIGKKLLEDSRAPDVQVRLVAVMSMVPLKEIAFRRALTRCSSDDNEELRKLALSGLEALAGLPGGD